MPGLLALALTLGTALDAQPPVLTPLYQVQGPGSSPSRFGESVLLAGDFDRDGYGDLIIGQSDGGSGQQGAVYLVSGKTSGELGSPIIGDTFNDEFGRALTVLPDLDNDGVIDFAVGAPQPGSGTGYVRILAGKTHNRIRQHQGTSNLDRFGHAIGCLPSIDNDNLPEVVVGAPGVGAKGAVYALSGQDGRLLWKHESAAPGSFGYSVAILDDVTGDGVADVLVGNPNEVVTSPYTTVGRVTVLSGKDGMMFAQVPNAEHGRVEQQFGVVVASCGDLDNDGTGDLALLRRAPPAALIFSGRSLPQWTQIATITPLRPDADFLMSIAAAGDFDKDGMADIMVGEKLRTGGSGALHLVQGKEVVRTKGQNLPVATSIQGPTNSNDHFGVFAAVGYSATSSAQLDVVVGSSKPNWISEPPGHKGYVSLYTLQLQGLKQSVPAVSIDSGGTVNFDLDNSEIRKTGTTLWHRFSATTDTVFGHALAAAGDLDRDGWPDILAGAPYTNVSNATEGAVFFLSGRDGSQLRPPFTRTDNISWLGSALATIGDVDSDGQADFLMGAPGSSPPAIQAGSAIIVSARTGAVLWRDNGVASGDYFGWSVASLGDLDNDGRPEFAVGAFGSNLMGLDSGAVSVYSGDKTLVRRFAPASPGATFGYSLAGLGDVDLDGVPDYAAGGPGFAVNGRPNGSVWVYSGKTHAQLHQLVGKRDERLGSSVAACGDIDGDLHADIAVGTYSSSRMIVYSGRTGSILMSLRFENGTDPIVVEGAGDLDLDGTPDLLAARWEASFWGYAPGAVYAVSGKNASILHASGGLETDDNLGFALLGRLDLDRDGRPDIVVGSPLARLTSTSPKPTGRVAAISVHQATPSFYWLLGSLTATSTFDPLKPLNLKLQPDPYFALTLLQPNHISNSLSSFDTSGKGRATLQIPPNFLGKEFLGVSLHHAAITLDVATRRFVAVTNPTVVSFRP